MRRSVGGPTALRRHILSVCAGLAPLLLAASPASAHGQAAAEPASPNGEGPTEEAVADTEAPVESAPATETSTEPTEATG